CPVDWAARARPKTTESVTRTTVPRGSDPQAASSQADAAPDARGAARTRPSSAMSTGRTTSSTTIIAALARLIGTLAVAMARTTACIATPASTEAVPNPARTGAPKRVGPRGAPSQAHPKPETVTATREEASGRAPGTSIASNVPAIARSTSTIPSSVETNDQGGPPCESPRSPDQSEARAAARGTPAARTRTIATASGEGPASGGGRSSGRCSRHDRPRASRTRSDIAKYAAQPANAQAPSSGS